MTHEWTTTAIVATTLTGCLDDEAVSTTAAAATVFSLDVATTPFHRTGDVRGITIDTIGNRLVSYGTSNYSLAPELSSCGSGSDENMDQMAATFFHHTL